MNAVRPTTMENAGDRLFLRFFLIYLVFFLTALLTGMRFTFVCLPENIGLFQFLMIPLALLGGLMTVSKVYLFLISAVKAVSDAAFLLRVSAMVRTGAVGFWQWNAAFFLLAFSLLIFTFACSKACLFSFSNRERDLRLIFSKAFAAYLFKIFVLTLLALSLYFLFSRLETLLPA